MCVCRKAHRSDEIVPRVTSKPSRKDPRTGSLFAEPPERRGGAYEVFQTDAFEWLAAAKSQSIHAVVTDPPYGLLEYSAPQLEKLRNGRGGVWRIPPSFDGCQRRPLPRFTVLTAKDRLCLRRFFQRLGEALFRVLVPGAHVFIATNPLVSHLVYVPFIETGFEKRGEVIRVVHTLRGGDRPKNAHEKFPDVSVMPKSCWEPWGLFRKPCVGRVEDNLRQWKTGALRRPSAEEPFRDLIRSSPARGYEREIAPHPSLKPQRFLKEARPRLPSPRQRHHSGPLHGLRFDDRGRVGHGAAKHRTGNRPDVLRHGHQGHPLARCVHPEGQRR